jgi:hypothetical protein
MSACTAIAPARHKNLYRDCKSALQAGSFAKMIHRIIFTLVRAMPRSLRFWWDNLHSQFGLTASIRLSTTNALYCRAVSIQVRFT